MTFEKALETSTPLYSNLRYSGLCTTCGKLFYSGRRIAYVCSQSCCSGPQNGMWKGGRYKNNHGYIILSGQWNHPRGISNRIGCVPEHILIMEKHLGRYLKSGESVHHKNGIKDDNRIENLELMVKHPSGQRVEDLLNFVVSTYPDELKKRLNIPPASVGADTL